VREGKGPPALALYDFGLPECSRALHPSFFQVNPHELDRWVSARRTRPPNRRHAARTARSFKPSFGEDRRRTAQTAG
jgi:hypothetical protein